MNGRAVVYLAHQADGNVHSMRRSGRRRESTDEEDIVLVKEVGPVAIIDYPHHRGNCSVFPFFENGSPLNVRYCNKCFCFMCDVSAHKCEAWGSDRGDDPSDHCHAFSNESWEAKRREEKKAQLSSKKTAQPFHLSRVETARTSGRNHHQRHSQENEVDSTSDMSTDSPEATVTHPWTTDAQLREQELRHMVQMRSGPPWNSSSHRYSTYDITKSSRMRSPGGGFMQLPHPRDDIRLGLLGSVQIKCKVPDISHHKLVPVGFWDIMTQKEIIQICYDHDMVSLWNLHLYIDFESIVDIQWPGIKPAQASRSLIAELQQNCLGTDDGYGKIVPRMYVHLESKRGATEFDREIGITEIGVDRYFSADDRVRFSEENVFKVYLWKIGLQWCLLGDTSCPWRSSQPLETLMTWLSYRGSWNNSHQVQEIHAGILRWQNAIQTPVRYLTSCASILGHKAKLQKVHELVELDCQLLATVVNTEETDVKTAHATWNKEPGSTEARSVAIRNVPGICFLIVHDDHIPEYLKLMSHGINSSISSTQSSRLNVVLRPYQLHSIERMHNAESQELGFNNQFWVQLELEDQPFWYSPFLNQVCIEQPYPQCRGGFLADAEDARVKYTVLGLVLAHPAPIPFSPSCGSTQYHSSEHTRATLVVCATRELGKWLSLRQAASKPFSIVAYEDTEEFWSSVEQRDIIVVTYADVTKEYRNLSMHNPPKKLFQTLWYRLVFANGGILSPTDISPDIRLACTALGSILRWVLMKTPITGNVWGLLPKLQVLRVAPWSEHAFFEEMFKEEWRPFYLLSQLIVRHETKAVTLPQD